jgi:hypothetical protein
LLITTAALRGGLAARPPATAAAEQLLALAAASLAAALCATGTNINRVVRVAPNARPILCYTSGWYRTLMGVIPFRGR